MLFYYGIIFVVVVDVFNTHERELLIFLNQAF